MKNIKSTVNWESTVLELTQKTYLIKGIDERQKWRKINRVGSKICRKGKDRLSETKNYLSWVAKQSYEP